MRRTKLLIISQQIDEAGSFRARRDDGRRDPVCYSAYFADLSRHPVTTNIFDEKMSWHPGHIELADNADLVLIAPATADILAKLAHGFADDALTSIVLATEAPLLLAPAMNGKMWMHPATVANVEILRQRGANFIGPEKGILACDCEGIGRLWPVDEIVAKALEYKKR